MPDYTVWIVPKSHKGRPAKKHFHDTVSGRSKEAVEEELAAAGYPGQNERLVIRELTEDEEEDFDGGFSVRDIPTQ